MNFLTTEVNSIFIGWCLHSLRVTYIHKCQGFYTCFTNTAPIVMTR